MSDCPTEKQLDLFSKKTLDASEQAALIGHLKGCAACRQTVASLAHEVTVTLDAQDISAIKAEWVNSVLPELADHPRYRILGLVNTGGMGALYKAEHRFLERFVVLKVIRRDLLNNEQLVRRFEREAKLAAQLSHPNIVTVYEAEKAGSTQFLVMEFLEGQDLGQVVSKRGPIQVAEACGWVCQAAAGLGYIHGRGMVHRDIKPNNLFLTSDGWVKILDLGLACLRFRSSAAAQSELTLQGQVLGTVGFCSPEQLEESSEVDIRSDIYSLGCTLYHLLSGQPPFGSSANLAEHILAHRSAPVPPLRQLRSDVPEELVGVLDRMLAKKPSDRYATPAEVVEALSPFAGPDLFPSGARSTGSAVRPAPRRKWWFGKAAIIGYLMLLLLAGGLVYWLSGSRGARHGVAFPGGLPIKVGILHSRTGTMAMSEKPVIEATLFAIEEINAEGGIAGRRIDPVVEDGQSDPTIFSEKAEKLISKDQVSAIFGCWTSASRKAVKQVVEKHDSLLMYPVQNEGLEQSPNIIYLGASPNQQIIPAVKWCESFLKKKRFFLVGSDYVFPRAANAIIRDQIKGTDAEVVGEEYLLLGSTQTAAVVDKIIRSKADIILNTINGDTNIAFFRALRAAGISSANVPTISFSISENGLSSLSIQDVVGDYAAWNYFQDIDRPQNEAFLKGFRERFGADRIVSDPMEAAYVAVRLWGHAVRAAGSDSPGSVRKLIPSQSFEGPEGLIKIDPSTGRAIKFIRIGRMTEKGQFEIVYSSDIALEPVPYPETRSRAGWESFLTDLQLAWGGQWANPKR
jgi:urea transport system substrate-binding protein